MYTISDKTITDRYLHYVVDGEMPTEICFKNCMIEGMFRLSRLNGKNIYFENCEMSDILCEDCNNVLVRIKQSKCGSFYVKQCMSCEIFLENNHLGYFEAEESIFTLYMLNTKSRLIDPKTGLCKPMSIKLEGCMMTGFTINDADLYIDSVAETFIKVFQVSNSTISVSDSHCEVRVKAFNALKTQLFVRKFISHPIEYTSIFKWEICNVVETTIDPLIIEQNSIMNEGRITVYKKIESSPFCRDDSIHLIMIGTVLPEWKRISVNRKCRVEAVIVERIFDPKTGEEYDQGYSRYAMRTRSETFKYVIGETVRPDSFDESLKQCSYGIHVFTTYKEALEY